MKQSLCRSSVSCWSDSGNLPGKPCGLPRLGFREDILSVAFATGCSSDTFGRRAEICCSVRIAMLLDGMNT
jgi:hypothetical protein